MHLLPPLFPSIGLAETDTYTHLHLDLHLTSTTTSTSSPNPECEMWDVIRSPAGLYILHIGYLEKVPQQLWIYLELRHIHLSDLSFALRSLRASIINPRPAIYSTMSGQRFEPKNMLVSWRLSRSGALFDRRP